MTGPSVQRSLVMLPRELSGLLGSLPVLEILASSREVFAFVDTAALGLLELVPGQVAPLPRLGRTAADRVLLQGADAEEAFVLSDRARDGWLALSAGIPRRFGYRSLFGWLFLNRLVGRPRVDEGRPASADHRVLVEAAGGAWPAEDPPPRLVIDEARRAEAVERLARARLGDDSGPLVGVYAGAEGGLSGAPWPRTRFEELLREMRRRHPAWRWVLLATTQDLWTAVRLHEETGKLYPVIGPDLRLDVLAALLGELDLVVAGDSWMLQLAAAAGTPTVGLLARDPRRWGPRGPGHRAVAARRGEWLRSIAVEGVVEVVEDPCGR